MTDILVNAAAMPAFVYSRHEPSAKRGLPARRIAMRSRRSQERRLRV